MNDVWLLYIAVACAIPYGGVILVLLFNNPKRLSAWLVSGVALFCWPGLFFMSFMQLVFVIPMVAVYSVNGFDLSKPLSAKAVYWGLGATLAFIAFTAFIAILLP
jgi:hypothetical protein